MGVADIFRALAPKIPSATKSTVRSVTPKVISIQLANENEISPVIDKVYSFEEARQAYEHLARGAFGKVVIKIS